MDPLTLAIIGVGLWILWPKITGMLAKAPIERVIKTLEGEHTHDKPKVKSSVMDSSCLECLNGFVKCLPEGSREQIVKQYASDLFMKEYGYSKDDQNES